MPHSPRRPLPAAALVAALLILSALASQLDAQSSYVTPYTFTTIAGTPGVNGYADGPAGSARFDNPQGIAVDTAGNVYVSDTVNFRIRKITPAGDVTTLAGSGSFGATDGPAAAATFAWPTGLAVDRATGSLVIADTWNYTVRLLSSGSVATLAGLPGSGGYIDGALADARFTSPGGVALTASGVIYLADTYNNAIRKISLSDGVVSTLAGTGYASGGWVDATGANARFFVPYGVAVDDTDTVYVADSYNHAIRQITPDGDVSTLAGRGTDEDIAESGSLDATGTDARFYEPRSLAVDSAHNLYVADTKNHLIRKITPAGLVTTLGGLAGIAGFADGTGAEAQFNLPQSIAVDGAGTIYVADTANHVIRKGMPALVGPRSILANIATRAYCATGNNVTIGGFVVSGRATKRVLIRAVGPTLASQGLSSAEILADPVVEVHDAIHGNATIATNDNWTDSANSAEITSTAVAVGAAPLVDSDTKSAALVATLQPGVYSFVVTGKNSTSGIVLLEVYDADAAGAASTFSNIATRADATTGNGVAIGGFVISGSSPKGVLIRAVGPTLTTQGLASTEVLADPTIELHDAIHGNAIIGTNDNWTDQADAIRLAGARLGATPFASNDAASAALLITLQPGVYTFLATGKNNSTGITLIEVYDAD